MTLDLHKTQRKKVKACTNLIHNFFCLCRLVLCKLVLNIVKYGLIDKQNSTPIY